MKYILLNVLLLVTLLASGQKLDFTGEIAGLQKGTKVILSDLMGKRFHDTALVNDYMFKFDTKLPGAGIYVLRIGLIGQEPEHRKFYLDAGKVKLVGRRGELKKATISSDAPYMKDYIRFTDLMEGQEVFARKKAISDSAIMRAAETGSYEGLFKHPDLVQRLLDVDREAAAKAMEVARQWLSQNPHSDINAYVIYIYLRRQKDDKAVKAALVKLSPSARKSLPGEIISNEFDN